jgi:hypothetical protein
VLYVAHDFNQTKNDMGEEMLTWEYLLEFYNLCASGNITGVCEFMIRDIYLNGIIIAPYGLNGTAEYLLDMFYPEVTDG